ncbi:MAG: 30S ribosomal protein S1 [Planctomycetota bacterium]|jgi:small subunit ribosomal protein S1
MVDRNIVNRLGLSEEDLEQQVNELFTEKDGEFLEEVLRTKIDSRLPGTILQGAIVTQIGNDVIVEVGLKSEGVVDASEFDEPEEIAPGKEIEVLLEDFDCSGGLILLSKRKADRIRGWETIINTKKEGDAVTGRVIRRIKGGLLVDIGVPVFLPASQVDIRRPGDISRFIGREIDCIVLKIDVEGRNIVVSRRRLIEEERRSSKEKIMAEIEVSQLRKGVVKNISDFGVFVDLGGVDGLLHISDLSWGRISHPSEVVKLDQEIECVVIGVDKDEEKISLGLKQKTPSPWENVENRYPVGARVKGTVVNIMNYGAFIRLEEGIEGLVHISEMSWTKRLSHPSEMLGLNDEIEVVVLNVNKEKREISLGLKQTEINPWTIASQKYPAGTVINTSVRSMTNFGVFVEIEPGIDGMVHISDLSWTKKYNHPSEMLQKGEEVKCVVLDVNEEKRRISLGIKQMTEDPWIRAIPEKYIPGQIIKGTITKLTNFGAFVELEPNLEGLLHISELADHKIDKPQDVVKLGEEVEVKILRIDSESRKIGLSLRRARWAAEEQAAEAQAGEASKSQEPTGEPEKDSDKPTESGEQAAEAVAAEASSEVTESEAQAPEKPQDSAEPTEPGEQAAEATAAEAGSEVAESETQAPEEPQDSAEPTEPTEQAVEAAATDAGSEVAESGPDMAEEPKESAEPEPTEPTEQAVEAQAGEAEEPKEVQEPQEGTDEQTEKDAQADEQTGGENAAEENAEADTDK